MSELQEPLVGSEVDLSDMGWMPLDIHRLRRSKAWLLAKRDPELGFYMLNLWTAAWHERPAGSLEDDDELLCELAMCDPKKWSKLREKIMRGWVKCSDGRLYHPVVAEKVAETWERKRGYQEKAEKMRRAKIEKKANKNNEAPSYKEPLEEPLEESSKLLERSFEPLIRQDKTITNKKGKEEAASALELTSANPPAEQKTADDAAVPGSGRLSPENAQAEALHRACLEAADGAVNPTSPAILMFRDQIRWLRDGCDPELDVLPTIRALADKRRRQAKPLLQSWAWFDLAIVEARDARMRPMPRGQPAGGQSGAGGAMSVQQAVREMNEFLAGRGR